jgi:hypothetical protein
VVCDCHRHARCWSPLGAHRLRNCQIAQCRASATLNAPRPCPLVVIDRETLNRSLVKMGFRRYCLMINLQVGGRPAPFARRHFKPAHLDSFGLCVAKELKQVLISNWLHWLTLYKPLIALKLCLGRHVLLGQKLGHVLVLCPGIEAANVKHLLNSSF